MALYQFASTAATAIDLNIGWGFARKDRDAVVLQRDQWHRCSAFPIQACWLHAACRSSMVVPGARPSAALASATSLQARHDADDSRLLAENDKLARSLSGAAQLRLWCGPVRCRLHDSPWLAPALKHGGVSGTTQTLQGPRSPTRRRCRQCARVANGSQRRHLA